MSDDQRPVWDDDFAQEMLGKVMLVGMTIIEHQGNRTQQFYGVVMSADPTNGIAMRLEGTRSGEIYRLPPDLRGVKTARPGSYRLRTTQEIVDNPDYTAAWTVHPRSH